MKKDELTLERQCREWARLNGWAAFKIENNGNKGIPDDGFLHPSGVFLMVEFKASATDKVRPEQKMWAAKFYRNVRFCHDFDTFKSMLEMAKNGQNPSNNFILQTENDPNSLNVKL